MAREWSGIDRLRLDKFMGLVRRFLGAGFHAAAGTGFAASATARLLAPVAAALVPPADSFVGSGLALQIADAAGSELEAAAATVRCGAAGARRAVAPFVAALAATPRPELAARLTTAFFAPLAASLALGASGSWAAAGPAALASAVAADALAAAASPATRARNRGHLNEVADAMEQAAKEAGGSVPAAAPAKAAAVAPEPAVAADPPPPRKSKKAKRRAERDAAAAAAAAAPGTPPTAKPPAPAPKPAAAAATPAPPPTRKRVQWALKANLAHAVGGPVPPAAVRTPPAARPRGPALKKRKTKGGGGRKA